MQDDQTKSPLDSDPAITEARRIAQSAASRHRLESVQAVFAREQLQVTYAQRAESHIEAAVTEIQLATDNCRHSVAWRAINQLTGRRSRPNEVVSASSIQHRKHLLAAHYSKVLNAPAPTTALLPIPDFSPADPSSFNTGPFSFDEVKHALETMSADAAAGVDGISPRVLNLPELTRLLPSSRYAHSER